MTSTAEEAEVALTNVLAQRGLLDLWESLSPEQRNIWITWLLEANEGTEYRLYKAVNDLDSGYKIPSKRGIARHLSTFVKALAALTYKG